MHTSIPSILSLQQVSIGYQGRNVLEDVNFEVKQNDIVAILGLNGTGKSTLMRTIARLQPFLFGEIQIQGKSLGNYSQEAFAEMVSIVLPGRGDVIPSLYVAEILNIARSPYSNLLHTLNAADHLIITNIIEQLHLTNLLKRKLFQLSDGEAQRVFIARALIQQTPVLLLDEPTSHLDISNKIEIFKLIRSLKKDRTILFTSHEMDLALQIADKCILLDSLGNYVFGATNVLIANGSIGKYFDSEQFLFDPNTSKFDVKW